MENMPPGYRFYPTEEELISFYLHKKLQGERDDMNRVIPVLDIYDYNPWELPQLSGEASLRDTEQWFFFIPRQESEARGGKPKRLTTTGYWKATGSPNRVYSSDNCIIGMKRTMVFYNGRAPNGSKTEWKMNEYKAIKGQPSSSRPIPTLRQEYSLCRVYKKTKCLRAFDRRPPPRGNHMGRGCHPNDVKKAEDKEASASASALASASSSASTSYHQHNPPHMAERGTASSSESSSSGEHGQTSHCQMDDEPLLDWKQVDRFLGNWDIEDDSKA